MSDEITEAIPLMPYAEALKKVKEANKNKGSNLMLIEFQWAFKVVLPYADGLAFMDSLKNAELIDSTHDDEKIRIMAFPRDKVTITVMSQEEYDQIKMAELLQVKLSDIKKHKITLNQ